MDVQGKRLAIATALVLLAFVVLMVVVATIGEGLRPYKRAELTLTDIDIAADALGIGEARLNMTTYLDNSGEANSGDTTITVKAYDVKTNLLIATTTTSVGVINAGETRAATTYLTLPKENDYRLQVVIFEDGKGILRGERYIYGLARLEPPSVADIALREIDFLVEAVETDPERHKEYAVVNTTLYLDNLGKDVSDLKALLKARDNETRLITDRTWLELGQLKEGTTSLRYAELRVLNGRDYLFEIQVWQAERIIKESSGMVLLSPLVNRTVVLEAKEKTVEISPTVTITDFIAPGMSRPMPEPYPTPAPAAIPKAPGFEALFAAGAVVIVIALLVRRRKRGE